MPESHLKPLPQSALSAAILRRMANELLMQAQALEAEAGLNAPPRQVEFMYSRRKKAAVSNNKKTTTD